MTTLMTQEALHAHLAAIEALVKQAQAMVNEPSLRKNMAQLLAGQLPLHFEADDSLGELVASLYHANESLSNFKGFMDEGYDKFLPIQLTAERTFCDDL